MLTRLQSSSSFRWFNNSPGRVQSLYGQATGSISGTVTDVTGSAVPGAKVTVTAPATGASRSSTTNDSGEYIVPLLGVANYTVQVELAGFPDRQS